MTTTICEPGCEIPHNHVAEGKILITGLDNYRHPKQDFADKLASADEGEFLKIAEDRIWLSAYASNNPRSDYHWQADLCYDEASRRGRVGLYREAYARAFEFAMGYRPTGYEYDQRNYER